MPDAGPDPEITIRRASTPADYAACQEAQRRAWGITDASYLVPIATMVGAQWHGGLVLGAYLPGGEAVGVSFAFLGRSEDRPCLYSQLTGVVPGYQSLGLGRRLKEAQREFARASGLPILAWAFDPLQAGNARFNLHKLGASAVRFVVDMYGPRTDALNRGAATDRLIAEWNSEPITSLPTSPTLIPSTSWRLRADDRGRPVAAADAGTDQVRIEIPTAIATLRQSDPELANAWTLAVRAAFLSAFAEGFQATDFATLAGGSRSAYILTRQADLELPYINA